MQNALFFFDFGHFNRLTDFLKESLSSSFSCIFKLAPEEYMQTYNISSECYNGKISSRLWINKKPVNTDNSILWGMRTDKISSFFPQQNSSGYQATEHQALILSFLHAFSGPSINRVDYSSPIWAHNKETIPLLISKQVPSLHCPGLSFYKRTSKDKSWPASKFPFSDKYTIFSAYPEAQTKSLLIYGNENFLEFSIEKNSAFEVLAQTTISKPTLSEITHFFKKYRIDYAELLVVNKQILIDCSFEPLYASIILERSSNQDQLREFFIKMLNTYRDKL